MRQISPASFSYTLLLGLIAGLPALSIDLSAPTLAILPAALGTDVFTAGLSLSLFVLGFGIGQFGGGRGSDQFGRRPVLLAALSTYIAAGLCCAIVTSGGELASARLVQGLGAGACSVQAFAMVQDLFAGERARREQAYVTVVLTVMPLVAPALGALVIDVANWRLLYVGMVVAGLLLMAVIALCVGETRRPPTGAAGGIGLAQSAAMLRAGGFRRITSVNALSYAALFAYIAGAPVVVISDLGFNTYVYAAVFACTAASLSGGAMLSARLAPRFETRRLVGPALLLQVLSSLGLVAATLLLPQPGEWLLLPLLIGGCFARGVAAPNLVHAAISSHRDHAGLAAALVGLAQLIAAAISSALLARALETHGPVSMATAMAALSLAALVLWLAGGAAPSAHPRPEPLAE